MMRKVGKVNKGPPPAVSKAYQLMQAGHLSDAELLLRQFLLDAPNFAPALHLLGLVRNAQGATQEALVLVGRTVDLAPQDIDAWRNLGSLYQDVGGREQAEVCFRRVLKLAPKDIAARGNLSLLLEETGRDEEAITELRLLLKHAPKEVHALRTLAALLRKHRQHREEVMIARQLVGLVPSEEPLKRALSRSYFLWFDSEDRDVELSRKILDEWLVFDPTDPVALHMRAAHGGASTPSRASDRYVERHFDEFSETFDQVLGSLNYRGPALIDEALRRVDPEPRANLDVVDIGCGTGASGPLVRPWARRLVGVDLSQKMLEQAKRRGVYDELVHGEITGFLERNPDTFDLVLCADTLIYFGDILALSSAIGRALRPGGRFLATIELLETNLDNTSHFRLGRAGRYLHTRAFLTEAISAAGLVIEETTTAPLRVEYEAPVMGLVVSARRPAGTNPAAS